MRKLGFLVSLLVVALSTISAPAIGMEKVTLQLKWEHQFQFAGYYAAKAMGYYADAGLDVEIIAAEPETDVVERVVSGEAEFGVGNSDLILSFHAGKPVVVLGVILQHSPFVILTRKDSGIRHIHDLHERKLMLESMAAELKAYLVHEGVSLDSIIYVKHQHSPRALINREVDAMSAYVTDEPYYLEQEGVEYLHFDPRSAGIDFYGDNLFTSLGQVEKHPERTRRFREASMRGWLYAMSNPEKISDIILTQYNSGKSREYLLKEFNEMEKLMRPGLIDIGYMFPGRWRHIAETYASLNMLPETVSLDGFLFDIHEKQDYTKLYMALTGSVLMLLIISMVARRFHVLNQHYKQLLYLKTYQANIGESFSYITHQWRQPLNEIGIKLMLIEQEAAKLNEASRRRILRKLDESSALLQFMGTTIDTFRNLLVVDSASQHFDITQKLQEALALMRSSFEKAGLAPVFENRVGSGLEVAGNGTEFIHAVLSILVNAKEIFAERGVVKPQLSVWLSGNEGMAIVRIHDNGGGVSVYPPGQIFQAGFSLKTSPSSGLGLYVAREIIERKMGGKITVANERGGATFTLRLRIYQES